MRRAVVLFSGGLDSTTVLSIAKNDNWQIFALSFNYGQNHQHELTCAARIAKKIGVSDHMVIDFNLQQIGGSALTSSIRIPKSRVDSEVSSSIPVTYVPARNTIFLSFAVAWAEVLNISDIFIGVNALDYSGYPDCRPEYLDAYKKMANLATKAGVEGKVKLEIHSPLVDLTKAQIIQKGMQVGVDFSLTSSCYDPGEDGNPCLTCDSCILRAKGFREVGLQDPLLQKFGLV